MQSVMVLALMGSDVAAAPPPQPLTEPEFNRFYERVANDLWRYIARMTGNATLADDLFQKTFFRFLRSNPELIDESHGRALLHRIATNLVIDHWRQEKHERGSVDVEPQTRTPDLSGIRLDVRRLLATLKPQERALLWMAHVEEQSHSDIANALGVGEKSVRVLLFRARKRFADLLRKHGISAEVLA